MESTSATTQLDATINALQGGLSSAAGAAGSNISGWIQTLKGNQQLSGISSELQKLQDALSGGASDTSAISQSLSKLGEQTTAAASSASADSKDKLMQLGKTLSSAASQLK